MRQVFDFSPCIHFDELSFVDTDATLKQTETRKMIIDMILKTDMVFHMDHVGDAKALLESVLDAKQSLQRVKRSIRRSSSLSSSVGGTTAKADNQFQLRILNLVLHACDISTAVRPFPTFLKFSECILAEFFAQGDEERTLGLQASAHFVTELADIFDLLNLPDLYVGEPTLRSAPNGNECRADRLHRFRSVALVFLLASDIPFSNDSCC